MQPRPVAALTLLLLASAALAQRTTNRGLQAVPAPGAVVIDGDLAEWDLSGEILSCKDVGTLLDTESARVAAMWDAANLYVSFRVRDPSPLRNNIDPVTMAGNGWRSDAVQLRFCLGGFVAHVDSWYYTPGAKPALSIKYGRHGGGPAQPEVKRPADPTQLGAAVAFRPMPDGGGYVQEIRLPWAVLTLTGKAPLPSALLQMGLEVFWGDASAETWPRSRLTDNLAADATTTDFFWQNDKLWGRLVLAPKGKLALPAPIWQRSTKEPLGPVPLRFALPRRSFVTLALEDARGNRVCSLLGGVPFDAGQHVVYWAGLDDRHQVLPPGRYRWVGLYRDALHVRWLTSFYQPNRDCPWQNAAGTGAWGPDHGNLRAAAAGDGRVFLTGTGVEAGFGTFAVDPDGRKQWTVKFLEAERCAYVAGTLYALTSAKTVNFIGFTPLGVAAVDAQGRWLDLPGPDGRPVKRRALLAQNELATGFAADDQRLYVAVAAANVVRCFDRATLAPAGDWPVSAPGELYALGDGRVLATTPSGLVQLRDGRASTLLALDLGAARALTAGPDGTVYVALGEPRHQVLVLRRQGERWAQVGALGRAGGRVREGWYDPAEGFVEPSGLAVDARGRLWVVENTQRPKRVSVWQDGRWARDYVGDTGYGGGGLINPLDPREAFYDDMVFALDLDRGDWRLTQIGAVLPAGLKLPEGSAGFGGRGFEYCTTRDNHTFLSNSRGAQSLYRKRADGRWALCVHIDPKARWAWLDRNDDCQVQPDEVTVGAKAADWGATDYWGCRPSRNLDLYFARGVEKPGLRLRCLGLTKGGTPLYDLTRFEPMGGECQNGIGLIGGGYVSGCAGERGEYFSELRRIATQPLRPRTFWYRGEHTGRWTHRLPAPGVVLYPFQAHGIAPLASGGEVVCWVSDFGQRYLFTDDMLYLDQLFRDARTPADDWPATPQRGFLADTMAPGQESFFGTFTQLKDGRYLLTTGFTDCRVCEVTGLESVRRIAGECELRAEHLGQAYEIRRFRQQGVAARPSLTMPKALAKLPLDGSLRAWARAGVARIAVDAERSAEIRAHGGDDCLYLAWNVKDPTPWTNQAERWELAFKGGDGVDLMFRPHGDRLDDPAVRAGDLRLLFVPAGEKVRAVLYRPLSARRHPFVFDAFEGAGRPNAVKMDEVRLADEVKAIVKPARDGYLVQAIVPFTLLGIKPSRGLELRLDFGVLFGDAAGRQTVLRSYWSNRDTNLVADIPSEAALNPGAWGQAFLGLLE